MVWLCRTLDPDIPLKRNSKQAHTGVTGEPNLVLCGGGGHRYTCTMPKFIGGD